MGTPVSWDKQNMSEGLKARLKRCGRSFKSPALTKKQRTADEKLQECGTPNATSVCKQKDALTSKNLKEASCSSEMPLDHCSNLEDESSNPCRRLDVEFSESDAAAKLDTKSHIDNETPSTREAPESDSIASLEAEKRRLLQDIKAKEEKLRKLKMVKMYRSKNNLDELTQLTEKWRSLSQDLILRLHTLTLEPRPSLRQLVAHLQIEPEMVGFNPDDESFS